MTKKGDFQIVTPSGEEWHGAYIEGRIAIYNADDQLVCVGPADLDFVESFGTVRAAGHIRARLILERGTSTPEY